MVIWLRQSGVAASGPELAGVGVSARVLRREEYAAALSIDESFEAARTQCEHLLEGAREQAAAIVAQAESDAYRLLEQAQTEYAEAAGRGYEEGMRRAAEDWFARSAQAMAERKAVQMSLRERMAELVVAAVEQITRHEDRSVLFARAVSAVERLVEGADYLKVRVHPEDYEAAQREFLLASAGWNKGGRAVVLSVTADRALAPGSCLCESDLGIVDASLDVQLNAVRAAVARAVERSQGGGDGGDTDVVMAASDSDFDDGDGVYEAGEDDPSGGGTDSNDGAGYEGDVGEGYGRYEEDQDEDGDEGEDEGEEHFSDDSEEFAGERDAHDPVDHDYADFDSDEDLGHEDML